MRELFQHIRLMYDQLAVIWPQLRSFWVLRNVTGKNSNCSFLFIFIQSFSMWFALFFPQATKHNCYLRTNELWCIKKKKIEMNLSPPNCHSIIVWPSHSWSLVTKHRRRKIKKKSRETRRRLTDSVPRSQNESYWCIRGSIILTDDLKSDGSNTTISFPFSAASSALQSAATFFSFDMLTG